MWVSRAFDQPRRGGSGIQLVGLSVCRVGGRGGPTHDPSLWQDAAPFLPLFAAFAGFSFIFHRLLCYIDPGRQHDSPQLSQPGPPVASEPPGQGPSISGGMEHLEVSPTAFCLLVSECVYFSTILCSVLVVLMWTNSPGLLERNATGRGLRQQTCTVSQAGGQRPELQGWAGPCLPDGAGEGVSLAVLLASGVAAVLGILRFADVSLQPLPPWSPTWPSPPCVPVVSPPLRKTPVTGLGPT